MNKHGLNKHFFKLVTVDEDMRLKYIIKDMTFSGSWQWALLFLSLHVKTFLEMDYMSGSLFY